MFSTALVLLHVSSAGLGIIAGFVSMAFRKGSDRHRLAGWIFFVSMLAMSLSAVTLAGFIRPNPSNVFAGSLLFYLVTTGWLAGRRRERTTGAYDVIALALIACVSAGDYAMGMMNRHARTYEGVPV